MSSKSMKYTGPWRVTLGYHPLPLIGVALLLVLLGGCSPTPEPIRTTVAVATVSPSHVPLPTDTTLPPSMPANTPWLTLTPAPTRPTATPVATATSAPSPIPMPTLPAACGTASIGGPGTQHPDSRHRIATQGVAILCAQLTFGPGRPQPVRVPQALIDLDTGTPQPESSDLEFEVTAGSDIFYLFAPVNGAQLGPVTEDEPGFDGCLRMQSEFTEDAHVEVATGDYFCVLTNNGHTAQVKVETYNPLGPYVLALEVSFITWADVIPTPAR